MTKPRQKRLAIIITAGPTREPIDPVRFISNHSSATIGYKLASYAAKRGHRVILISGPTQLKAPKVYKLFRVDTARQMHDAVIKNLLHTDALIMSAAVCDFRPRVVSKHKIKKGDKGFFAKIELVKNPDILKKVKMIKKSQRIVGFALETKDLVENAKKKLYTKDLDFIVANKIGAQSNPFGDNKISAMILYKRGGISRYKNISKDILAEVIIKRLEALWN